MTDHTIYLALSATAQFGLFEWSWWIAEVFMIIGSIGLHRYDLLFGLLTNFVFLTACLFHSIENWIRIRRSKQLVDRVKGALADSGLKIFTFEEYMAEEKKRKLVADGKHISLAKRDEEKH